MKKISLILFSGLLFLGCKQQTAPKEVPFLWKNANVYFLLTDRFHNGDTTNDVNFDRTKETGKLRGFEGGDLKGITQKIKEGYFTDLGVNAIWMTPIVEQIHGGTDEGTGITYGFHGYWTSDWTAIDPNYGTKEDLKELVAEAHKNGIRILLDAVINHTGPVTEKDPVWPADWVRTAPQCTYDSYENTIKCTLVKNLPDILTDSDKEVALPAHLIAKWKAEGRYEQEVKELDEFFKRTGYPRAPRFYIMKWLTDYITEFGIDGYRVDTVKHTEENVWQEFKKECDYAFMQYKKKYPEKNLDTTNFYLVGEVYGYGISSGELYNFGDKKVNYFEDAFQSLINFEFKWNAKQQSKEQIFNRYSNLLHDSLKQVEVLNYLSSHDDGQPFDAKRERPYETATMLLLAPGTSQTYYGDESARSLVIEGTVGDATLRSFMNWEAVLHDQKTKEILLHWQKLGKFRAKHPSVGAGVHKMISKAPYTFSRVYTAKEYSDKVLVALDLKKGAKIIPVGTLFNEGDEVRDAYSNQITKVIGGKVIIDSNFNLVLLENK
jgi:alpha-amylase